MARQIGLIAASRQQRAGVCRAAERYEPSPVFRRARDYCERAFGEWYILSPRHGVLAPQQVVGGRETSLLTVSAEQRAAWARQVAETLRARQSRSADPLVFVLYVSQLYADLLARAAPTLTFEHPFSGMTLRQRITWYEERLRVHSRVLVRV